MIPPHDMFAILDRYVCVADNGTEFTFTYIYRRRHIEVTVDKYTKHMTITNISPEDVEKEMNNFMDSWNQANPV
jgi:hypothetical protein